jgi:phosphoribosylanthranilate isomerase
MVKTKIKASKVRNLTDARYFAAREVEWLGIPFGQYDPEAVSPALAKAIIEWVDGVKIVGEFDFASAEEILSLNESLWFDAVQVGMLTPKAEMARLKGIALIKEVVLDSSTTLQQLAAHLADYASCADYFLLNLEKSGISWEQIKAKKPFSSKALQGLCADYRILLDIPLSPQTLPDLLSEIQPFGLNLAGGEEEKTGFKSFDELDEILDVLSASA